MPVKRTVLIIAYHFPPAGGVKIQRVVKLIKYIGEFSYRPVVLAPRGETRHAFDQASLEEVKSYCKVYRALMPDLLKPLFGLRNQLRRRQRKTKSSGFSQLEKPNTFRRKLLNFFFFPDISILWLIPAFVVGYRTIKREKVRLIISTSPPFSSHILARLLSRVTGVPYVVDFRDLWVDNPFVQQPTKLHLRTGRLLERKLLRYSAHVICATTPLKNTLVKEYGNELDDKITVITNGFDPADFSRQIVRESGRFKIVHGGSILAASGRNHFPLTEGVALAMREDSRFAEVVELTYFGFMDAENLNSLREYMDRPEVHGNIHYLGTVPHVEAIKVIRGVDLLVFIGGFKIDSKHNKISPATETDSIAAKIFEYLPCAKPILLIAQQCPTVDLALKSGLGIWCASYDPEVLSECILELYRRFYLEHEQLNPNSQLIKTFSRKHQAKQFAAIFDQVISSKLKRYRR